MGSDMRQAWYSRKQHRGTHSAYWLREDGTEVEVTEVTKVGTRPIGEKFELNDFVDRGVVVKWSRNGHPKLDPLG